VPTPKLAKEPQTEREGNAVFRTFIPLMNGLATKGGGWGGGGVGKKNILSKYQSILTASSGREDLQGNGKKERIIGGGGTGHCSPNGTGEGVNFLTWPDSSIQSEPRENTHLERESGTSREGNLLDGQVSRGEKSKGTEPGNKSPLIQLSRTVEAAE